MSAPTRDTRPSKGGEALAAWPLQLQGGAARELWEADDIPADSIIRMRSDQCRLVRIPRRAAKCLALTGIRHFVQTAEPAGDFSPHTARSNRLGESIFRLQSPLRRSRWRRAHSHRTGLRCIASASQLIGNDVRANCRHCLWPHEPEHSHSRWLSKKAFLFSRHAGDAIRPIGPVDVCRGGVGVVSVSSQRCYQRKSQTVPDVLVGAG